MTIHSKAVVKVTLVMLIWAGSFSVTKAGVDHIPPVFFAFLRFALASVILLIILFVKERNKPNYIGWDRSVWYKVIGMSITGVTLYYTFFNLALRYTSAAMGSLIQGFIPVGVVVLAALYLKERLQSIQLVGVVISIIGVICIGFVSNPETTDFIESFVWRMPSVIVGNILVILSALCWVIYTIISKKLAHLDSTHLTTWSTVIGTICFLPLMGVELYYEPLPVISWRGWLEIFYLGVLASALSYFWYNDAMKYLNAVEVGIFNNLDPVMGAVIAVVFLHEPISLWQVAGTVLVLLGVWISTVSNKKSVS
ncbi:DMT family transporter [Cytophagaceae bacterium YF14B1]|uniref:DMT family transporter n=1 Tax=Xanthocytophaga flava TaxID=3048013 RepID=A0AAE3QS86_9BACT|nr:DMT family transporter [Xanthocytophaga flavus]MDJ1484395.1 DMT family transporter [Xanthocytophaga flavus]